MQTCTKNSTENLEHGKLQKGDIVVGIDLSAAHLAAVAITSFGVNTFCISTKKFTKLSPTNFVENVVKNKGESSDTYAERRKHHIKRCLSAFLRTQREFIMAQKIPDSTLYVCIENYAFGSFSRAMTILAEITGVIKQELYIADAYVRLHEPSRIKKFATDNGNATKLEMIHAAVANNFIIDQRLYEQKPRIRYKKPIIDATGPGTDLADAYWMAEMLVTEVLVRAGHILIADLPENKREIFLSVTKQNPINLLVRPFIHWN